MNKEKTQSVAAIHEVLEMLVNDANAAEAEELAFYIGAAMQAAQDHLASERGAQRLRRSLASSK
jgi:hypothetical protein